MAANGDADSPTDTINPAFPDESPTLPPTPGDHNGQENYDPTPLPPSTSSQNQSSISSPSFTDSQRNIPERTTFERLDRLQSTSAFSNNPDSSYTINSPHYFHVTSPISQPQYPQNHQNHQTSALISPRPSSPGGRAPNRIITPQPMSSNQRDSIASGSQSPIIPAPNRRHPSHHYRGDGRRNHHGETHIPLTPPAPVPPAPAPAMYWSKIRTFGKVPKPLRSHTAILVEEQVFVFGGCDSRTCFNSVYVFDADTMYWNKPRTLGDPPPPCRAHSSTKVGKKLYIFGGGDGPTYFNDLYIFDTDTLTWTKPQTSGDTPTPRRAHTTEHYNNCIYIFGGGDGVCALNDVYMLDISDLSNLIWKKLEPSGGPPISRGYHTSNLVDNKLVIFGGSDGHECFDDVYVLDLEKNTWTKIDVSNSHRRLSHTSTQVGSYLFVVGGHDGTKYTSEVLLLNLVIMEWEPRSVFGTPPSGRGYHTTVLYDSRLFVFGGYDGHSVFDDVYILDLSACAYLPQIINFKLLEKTDSI